MKTLKESGQLENTIVIFTSDQGFAGGQHGGKEKWLPYDANIVAPLIIKAPNLTTASTVSKEPVNGVDITATIHDLAGIKPQWKMHGRSLLPLLKEPRSSLNSPMLMINTTHIYGDKINTELKTQNYDAFKRKGLYAWLMIRDGKYKYIRHFKDGVIEELYDLGKDPKELNNLAINPEYKSKLKELRSKTADEFRKQGGDFVDLLPEPKKL
jgi:arylsulfatase A-like enzyme